MTIIFVVFAITGTCSVKVADPFLELLHLTGEETSGWVYWPVKIVITLPLYQILLLFFGTLFGQFQFFWAFEKKMLSRMGIKFRLDES